MRQCRVADTIIICYLTTPFRKEKRATTFFFLKLLLVFECDGCFNCSTSIVMNDLSRVADWSIVAEAEKREAITWPKLLAVDTIYVFRPLQNLMKATANYLKHIRFDRELQTTIFYSFLGWEGNLSLLFSSHKPSPGFLRTFQLLCVNGRKKSLWPRIHNLMYGLVY